MEKLRTACMGLAGAGEDLLAAALADERFHVRAAFSSDGERLRRLREERGLAVYDDARSLIVETAREGLDLLLVALAPHESVEFLPLAAKHGAAVFHAAPFARTVEEGRGLEAAFAGAGRPLMVSRWWQFERAFAALRDAEGWFPAGFATVRAPVGDRTGWPGDRGRAGGGALLWGGYEPVDMLTTLMGLPEQVSAQCAYATRPGTARPYDTEDAAALLMQFSGGRIGTVDVVRGSYERDWRVSLVGSAGGFEVRPRRMTATPGSGGKPRTTLVRSANRFASELAIVAGHLGGVPSPRPATAGDHLATLAVVEAAYLSARTGAAESPARMLP